MPVENQRKLLKKDMKDIQESLVHLLRKQKRSRLSKIDLEQGIGKITDEMTKVISLYCGVRKQKTKRQHIHHYVFNMSPPLLAFVRTTLGLDAQEFPLLCEGTISSRSIPSIISLAGCSTSTAQKMSRYLPNDYAHHCLDTRKLNVPIFTTIIHSLREGKNKTHVDHESAENAENIKKTALEEYAKLVKLKEEAKALLRPPATDDTLFA